MPRTTVRLVGGTLAVCAMACSSPTADSTNARSTIVRQQVAGGLPVATGVTIQQLPMFDNPTFMLTAFNDVGEIVGDSGQPNGSAAFRWSAQNGLKTIKDTGSLATFAHGVNNHGQVVIDFDVDTTVLVAIWDAGNTVRLLPALPGTDKCHSGVGGINNPGAVVGECFSGLESSALAVEWTPAGIPGAMIPRGGAAIVGTGIMIANSGDIVGHVTSSNSGFSFAPDSVETLTPPVGGSEPSAINDSGWTAGAVFEPPVNLGPAAWLAADTAITLAGRAVGQATGINDHGLVTGTVQDTLAQNINVAFTWTITQGLRRLPGLPGDTVERPSSATWINHRRQILGQITLPSGVKRWVIWTLPKA